jgi:hypothetical protein
MKRGAPVAALIAGFLVSAQPSAAFKEKEHEALSTLALAVAIESLRGEIPADLIDEVERQFLQCSVKEKDRKDACRDKKSQCVAFGILTRAVDKVRRPEGLIPSRSLHLEDILNEDPELYGELQKAPERCHELQSPTTEKMEKTLRKNLDEEELFNFTSCRAERKVRQVWNWLLAVHQNASHFEACAATRYNVLHHLAVKLTAGNGQAGGGPLFVALAAEAVALHFLQDSLAPGHLLTPRSVSTDILARGMHNLHNRLGAPMFFNSVEPLAGLERGLASVLSQSSPPALVTEAARELSLCPHMLQVARQACKQRLSSDPFDAAPCYFGDGRLAGERQAVDLILLSAASIREVLLGGAPGEPLRIEFNEWSALPTTSGSGNVMDLDSLWGPSLSIMSPASADLAAQVQPPPTALAGFKKADGRDRFTMSLRHPEIAVAQVFGDSDQGVGWRAEVGWPSGDPNDRHIRRRRTTDKEDELVPCEEKNEDFCRFTSPGLMQRALGVPATWSFQAEEWSDYEALGLMMRGWLPIRMGRIGWDFLWGLEIGQKWYFSEARDTSRFVWGSHVAFGLGVIFIDLGFQRGNRLFEDGGQSRNSFYSAGVRFQIP